MRISADGASTNNHEESKLSHACKTIVLRHNKNAIFMHWNRNYYTNSTNVGKNIAGVGGSDYEDVSFRVKKSDKILRARRLNRIIFNIA